MHGRLPQTCIYSVAITPRDIQGQCAAITDVLKICGCGPLWCPHIDRMCRYCIKEGYLTNVRHCAKARYSAKSDPPTSYIHLHYRTRNLTRNRISNLQRKHYLQEDPELEDSSCGEEYRLKVIHDDHSPSPSPPPFTVTLHINDTPVMFEINTGAAVSISMWQLFIVTTLSNLPPAG